MKKNQTILLGALAFYTIAGLFVCLLFWKNGSFLSRQEQPKTVISSTVVGIPKEQDTASVIATPETETESETLANVEETPATMQHYYKFTTINKLEILHVRTTPSLEADILARLKPGTVGYVLEKGDAWSLITTGDITGYAFNEYLEFTEIPKEEYPTEYLDE